MPAARGVILALAKLCSQSHWHRRHLLALDICAAAAASDVAASHALISDFLEFTEPLSRSDPDAHLKARLKLQLQRNSVDIHVAQFVGHSSGAAAPTFAAAVGAAASLHAPKSAAFDSKAVNQVLQYCSDFLAVPFAIAAQVGAYVEEALERDILSQCRSARSHIFIEPTRRHLPPLQFSTFHDLSLRTNLHVSRLIFACSGWEHELEQMRLEAEEDSRRRAEAHAIESRAEAGDTSCLR